MRRHVLVALMAMVAVMGIRLPATAQVTDKDVRQAIERGVEFLKENQDKTRGGWREIEVYPGGLSALCTLALLESGLEPDDPAVAQALDYLRSFGKPDTVYSVSLRTMVLCAAEPKKDLLTIRQNVGLVGTDAVDGRDERPGFPEGRLELLATGGRWRQLQHAVRDVGFE